MNPHNVCYFGSQAGGVNWKDRDLEIYISTCETQQRKHSDIQVIDLIHSFMQIQASRLRDSNSHRSAYKPF